MLIVVVVVYTQHRTVCFFQSFSFHQQTAVRQHHLLTGLTSTLLGPHSRCFGDELLGTIEL